ncbi:MAG: hypothetical protein PHC34_06940 [Candidatus Gastranaerophilales bacterium]|nr:hypothetical protein [Candidatus Gastranaerophilales bacterium]
MYVTRFDARPILPPPRMEQKPKANFGENVQHTVDRFVNNETTEIKAYTAAGGVLGTGYALHNPQVIKGLIQKYCPVLENPAKTVYSGIKSLTGKAGRLASKVLSKVKANSAISKMNNTLAPYAKKAVNVLKAIPGPYKAVAAVAAGLILLKGTYNAGKIDQKFEDKVNLRHTLGGE